MKVNFRHYSPPSTGPNFWYQTVPSIKLYCVDKAPFCISETSLNVLNLTDFCFNFRALLAAKCLRTNMQSCWPSLKSSERRSDPHTLEVRVQWSDWKEVTLICRAIQKQHASINIFQTKCVFVFLQRNNPCQGAGAWMLGWDWEECKVLAKNAHSSLQELPFMRRKNNLHGVSFARRK